MNCQFNERPRTEPAEDWLLSGLRPKKAKDSILLILLILSKVSPQRAQRALREVIFDRIYRMQKKQNSGARSQESG